MRKIILTACALAACQAAHAGIIADAKSLEPSVASVQNPLWRGKAAEYLRLAQWSAWQSPIEGAADVTAERALKNARAILHASRAGANSVAETPLYGRKMPPAGRPARDWAARIGAAEIALNRALASGCESEAIGRLDVAVKSVWQSMEKSEGARWNHGRAQIARAVELIPDVERDTRACPNAHTKVARLEPAVVIASEIPVVDVPVPAPVVQAPVVQAPVLMSVTLGADTVFATNSYQLSAQGEAKLTDLAAQVKRLNAVGAISVHGYTDFRGTLAHNNMLSRNRAESVVAHLKAHGVNAAFNVMGYGPDKPVVECGGLKGAALDRCLLPNRRVEIKVMGQTQRGGMQ